MHITFPKAKSPKSNQRIAKGISKIKTSSNLPGAIYITTKKWSSRIAR